MERRDHLRALASERGGQEGPRPSLNLVEEPRPLLVGRIVVVLLRSRRLRPERAALVASMPARSSAASVRRSRSSTPITAATRRPRRVRNTRAGSFAWQEIPPRRTHRPPGSVACRDPKRRRACSQPPMGCHRGPAARGALLAVQIPGDRARRRHRPMLTRLSQQGGPGRTPGSGAGLRSAAVR